MKWSSLGMISHFRLKHLHATKEVTILLRRNENKSRKRLGQREGQSYRKHDSQKHCMTVRYIEELVHRYKEELQTDSTIERTTYNRYKDIQMVRRAVGQKEKQLDKC
jgi:hypothetical protein